MQSFCWLYKALGIIGFVTLAVAGLGIANVMYATVKRSTKDIGVRMAVGATHNGDSMALHFTVHANYDDGRGAWYFVDPYLS